MKVLIGVSYYVLLPGLLFCQTATQIDVRKINGATAISGTPTTGHCASFASSTSIQDAGAACGVGGGGGASQTAQLTDWAVTRASGTVLSAGANCVPSTPCNVSIGGVPTPFTNGPYTLTIATGTGTGSAYIYVSNTGTLSACYVLSSGAVTLSGSTGLTIATCSTAPTEAALLERWDFSGGVYNSTGIVYSSYLSYKPSPIAGTGLSVTAGSRDTIAIDTTAIPRKFSCAGGPGSTLPAGATQGDYCEDYTATPLVAYVCSNAGGCTVAGDFKVFSSPVVGTTILYRCSVAGTLRVGQATTVSGDCGTAVDTGLRVN